MADVRKIADELSELTVVEAANLARMLEERWSGAGSDYGSLVLFEDRERTRTEALRRGETLYDFYDSCAAPGYNEFRSVVNGWLALVADVERWARDNAELPKTEEVSKAFTAGDWIVELDLYAGGSNPEPPTEAIGVAQLRGGVIAPHKDLRDALYNKTLKYGSLNEPYLIAVADGAVASCVGIG
jgi:hypothetical protein